MPLKGLMKNIEKKGLPSLKSKWKFVIDTILYTTKIIVKLNRHMYYYLHVIQ